MIHFDQVLEAFGCIPLFILIYLASRSGKKVVVTVHEIDPFQLRHRRWNRLYNKCAEVLVHSENMKKQVVALGADPKNIRVIRYGAKIPTLAPSDRKQYIYFGGHNITHGKGYPELLDALALLKSRGLNITLVIYVGYGCNGLDEAKRLAVRKNVSDMIQWQDFYSADELARGYQRSKACIIPFTAGSARHPLTSAMVNATPVIATGAIDIPEYLGDLGIYVDGSAASIADAIVEIESGHRDLADSGASLRARALNELDYSKIAHDLSEEYARICAIPAPMALTAS